MGSGLYLLQYTESLVAINLHPVTFIDLSIVHRNRPLRVDALFRFLCVYVQRGLVNVVCTMEACHQGLVNMVSRDSVLDNL